MQVHGRRLPLEAGSPSLTRATTEFTSTRKSHIIIMNTASTIRSAVAGRSERFKHRVYEATGLGEVFNDSNVHLSVKSSPDKTAQALGLVAEKEGPLLKLNDTGDEQQFI